MSKRPSPGCILRIVFFSLICLNLPQVAHSEAFRILDQGASASGQGTAVAAQADSPSALHYNPAGMTQLSGIQTSIGALAVGGYYDYSSPGGSTFRADLDQTIAIPPPLNFYLTANLSNIDVALLNRITLGLGVNTPFGLIINYPKDVPFSSLDVFATLPLMDIKPTIAIKINDSLSLGGGLDIYTFAPFAGEGGAEVRAFTPPSTDIELHTRDTALGFNMGILYTAWQTSGLPRLNFAFIYRSESSLDLTGDFLVNGLKTADAAVDFTLPQIFTGGIALWPIRDVDHEWKVEFDVDYVDWNSFNDLNIRLSNGTTLLEPRHWNNVFIFKVGTEFTFHHIPYMRDWKISVRTGYIRSETPIPEEFFEPATPDADYNSFSVGLGFFCTKQGMFLGLLPCSNQLTQGIGLDVAYKNQIFESRTINVNFRPIVRGRWENILHAGVLNFRLVF